MTSFSREVILKDQVEDKAAFPFVFTSMMFDLAKEGWEEFGDKVYQVSQTPQLLLDNQVTLKTVLWSYIGIIRCNTGKKNVWRRCRLTIWIWYWMGHPPC